MNSKRFVVTLALLLLFAASAGGVVTLAAQRKAATKQTAATKKTNAGKSASTATAKSAATANTANTATPKSSAQTQKSAATTPKKSAATKSAAAATTTKKSDTPSVALSEDELKARLDNLIKLSAAERVEELQKLLKAHSASPLRTRAAELLASARAALGDEKLRAGEVEAGVHLFQLAVEEAPTETSDKLFVEVISQLPANLFLRGQREAAFALARRIEKGISSDPKRLLALASFYLGVEQADEAARLAETASQLAPNLAAAQVMLGNAHRVALRLDRAEASFRRALELDPQSVAAMRGLADMSRAAGKATDALNLYRQILTANARDVAAQSGLVLSLFESGKREEAERELESALKAEARNLPLLVGAAWWYLSQGDAPRALELATNAVRLEPRYTWAHVVMARALVAQKRPLEAEQSLRFARQYGRFPTLDYELANALAAAGLYEEAAEELSRSFTLRDGMIETRLAGRAAARAASFAELLAPERRASIAQSTGLDTDANARMLKGLLALHVAAASSASATPSGDAANTGSAASSVAFMQQAASDFVGDTKDPMRVFRQLYAAARMARQAASVSETTAQAAAWQPVLDAAEAAMNGLDAALDLPGATLAVMADELRDYRARSLAAGAVTSAPDVPRNVLSNVVRGRIEDLSGWALLNQGKKSEAVVRLRRAASVLPLESPWWRTAQWHLGVALEASGNQAEALNAYLKSYNPRSPDPARRAIIERLYQRLNGSLEGLEAKLGQSSLALSAPLTPAPTSTPATTTTDAASTTPPAASNTPRPATTTTTTTTATPSPTPEPAAKEPQASPTPDASTATPTPSPSTTPTPESAPPSSSASDTPPPAQTKEATPPAASPSNTPSSPDSSTPKRRISARHSVANKLDCELSLSESEMTLNRGASAVLTVTLNKLDNTSAVKVSTPDWAHIIILSEPRTPSDANNSARYTISSIGKTPGTYNVIFSSPCGVREVKVSVK